MESSTQSSSRRRISVSRVIFVAALIVFAPACSAPPLEFADWTLAVPEGTSISEYAFVPEDEREVSVLLERNLVVEEAFGRPLYRPRALKVADDGRFFVLDSGNNRVVAFAADGEPLVEFGQEGQGPGEFQSPRNLGIVGDNVVVWDSRNVRFSVYSMDGTHIIDHPLDERVYPRDYVDFEGRMLMAVPDPAFILPPGADVEPAAWRAGIYSLDGRQIELSMEFPYISDTQWERDRSAGSVPIRSPFPVAALGNGVFYVSAGSEYQVLAVTPHGEILWALRTDYTVPAVGEEHKREIVASLQEFVPGLTYQDFKWPERYAAIERLEIDGRGNLYVFPHTQRGADTSQDAGRPIPVDVFSPAGERIFSGLIALEGWDAALGDHVYRIETDADTEEQVVARYLIARDGR